MGRLLFKKIVAATLAFAVVLSCAGFDAAAAPTDTEEAAASFTEDAPALTDTGDETDSEDAKEVGETADTGETDSEEAEETDETAGTEEDESPEAGTDEDESPEAGTDEETDVTAPDEEADDVLAAEEAGLVADEAADGLKIKEIDKLSASERIISAGKKGTEEEAVKLLPDTWKVTLSDGTKKDVKVSWKCLDDFDDDTYSSFVFAGSIDDDTPAPLDEKLQKDMRMEIYFEDSIEHSGILLISRYSPNTMIKELVSEQGPDTVSEAFAKAYGNSAVIEKSVDYAASGTVLTKAAYNTFKKISPKPEDVKPAPDNYLYNKLNAQEKRFYNNIDKLVTEYLYYGKKCQKGVGGEPMTEYISSGKLDYDGMEKVFFYYYYDNPQAFFLTTKLNMAGTGINKSMAITIYPDTDTPKKLKGRAKKIAKNIRAMSAKVNKKSNDYNRARLAQSLICKKLSFASNRLVTDDWRLWTDGSAMYYKSLLSVFYGSGDLSMDGGYAKAFTAISRMAGLDAFVMNSPGNIMYPEAFEWNKVRLYGEWFCADTLSDDTDDLTGDGCTYEHFMKSDKTENKDGIHAWDAKWKNVAPASTRDYVVNKTKKYKIKYHLYKGKNNRFNPSYYTQKATKIILKDPTRTGYTFKGWYTSDSFHHRVKTISASERRTYDVYAKWKRIKYKVKYVLPKGVKNPAGNPKYYYVNSKTKTLKNPTRKGYIFKGWYKDKAYKKKITRIKKGSTGNLTLRSKWELKRYKLSYNLAKGVVNKDNPKYYTIEDKTFSLKDPTRPGYDFKGWYTDKDRTHRIRSINTKSLKEYTLYDKWKIKNYKITYKLKGGTNSSKNPKNYTVETKTITLKAPKRTGYTFGGWYTDAAYKNKITKIRKGSTGNLTLYAKWVKK